MRKIILNGCLQAGAAVFLALSIKTLLEKSTQGAIVNIPFFQFGLLLAVVGICAVLKWRERVLCENIGQSYVHNIRMALFDHLSRMSYSSFQEQRKGPLLLRFMNDLTALRQWITIGLSRLLIAISVVLMCLPALWFIHPYLGAVVSIIFSIAIAIALAMGPGLNLTVRKARKKRSILATRVTEKLMMVDVIQRMAARQIERRNVSKASRRLTGAMEARASRVGQLRGLTLLAGNLIIVMLAAFPLFLDGENKLTTGDVLAGLTLVSFLTPALFDLGRVFEYWHGAQLAAEKVERVFEKGPLIEAPQKGARKKVGSSRLRISGLQFGAVIRDLKLDLRPGQKVLISGKNGSGKSTLLRLIMRMEDPDAGMIQLGRTPLARLGLGNLRRAVTLITNSDSLIKGRISDNLKYPSSETVSAADKELLGPLKLGLTKRQSKFYLKNSVTEFGQNLSQGEKAIILLARAILRRPKILLIDEIDVHLDVLNKQRMMDLLSDYPGSVIFVSHDPIAPEFFDAHYRLTKGRLKKTRAKPTPIISFNPLKEVIS